VRPLNNVCKSPGKLTKTKPTQAPHVQQGLVTRSKRSSVRGGAIWLPPSTDRVGHASNRGRDVGQELAMRCSADRAYPGRGTTCTVRRCRPESQPRQAPYISTPISLSADSICRLRVTFGFSVSPWRKSATASASRSAASVSPCFSHDSERRM
jgi:hypothetical protein